MIRSRVALMPVQSAAQPTQEEEEKEEEEEEEEEEAELKTS